MTKLFAFISYMIYFFKFSGAFVPMFVDTNEVQGFNPQRPQIPRPLQQNQRPVTINLIPQGFNPPRPQNIQPTQQTLNPNPQEINPLRPQISVTTQQNQRPVIISSNPQGFNPPRPQIPQPSQQNLRPATENSNPNPIFSPRPISGRPTFFRPGPNPLSMFDSLFGGLFQG